MEYIKAEALSYVLLGSTLGGNPHVLTLCMLLFYSVSSPH